MTKIKSPNMSAPKKINFHHVKIFTPTLLLIGAVFSVGLVAMNSNVVVRGVRLASESVGNLSYTALSQKIRANVYTFENTPVVLILPDGTHYKDATPLLLGVRIDADATQAAVFSAGRTTSFLGDISQQFRLFIIGTDVKYQGTIDEAVMKNYLYNHVSQFYKPARDATIYYDDLSHSFVVQGEAAGNVINTTMLMTDLSRRMATLSASPIATFMRVDKPMILQPSAQNAKEQAINIISRNPLRLSYEDGEWNVQADDLASWLAFMPNPIDPKTLEITVDQQKVSEYLIQLAPGINITPVDAVFTEENDRVKEFKLSTQGRELNVEKSAQKIAEEIIHNSTLPVTLVVDSKDANITSEKINDLRITSLISSGTTDFAGSPKNRVHNIQTGAARFQGTLVAPGEEFSFNTILGEVDADTSYLPELVIKKDKTVPEYGGGICQISTTLFRAAVYAGFEITERYSHAYPVKYYGTPGFDATIYPPHPDLRFKNNTPGYVLIQQNIEKTKITFDIYGMDDGRKTKVDGPVILSKNEEDDSMKTLLTQTVVDKDGKIMFTKKFYSNYKSPELYPVNRNPYE